MPANWDQELGRRMQSEQKALQQLTQVIREHIAVTPGRLQAAVDNAVRAFVGPHDIQDDVMLGRCRHHSLIPRRWSL